MSCTACGADLTSNSQFCGECGTKNSNVAENSAVPRPAPLDQVPAAPVWAESCTSLAQWLSGLLFLSGALGLIMIPSLIASLRTKLDYLDGEISYFQALADLTESGNLGLALLNQLSTLVIFVLFIIWTNRAYRNLTHFGLTNYPKSTGWAIGGWFVPFYNAIVEKQIIDNIWRVSEVGPITNGWQKRDREKLFHIGWLLFFSGLALTTYAGFESGFQASASAANGNTIITIVDLPTRVFTLSLIGGVLTPFGQFFAAFGIRNISQRYETKRNEVATQSPR